MEEQDCILPRNFEQVSHIKSNRITDLVDSINNCINAKRQLQEAHNRVGSMVALKAGVQTHRQLAQANDATLTNVREQAVSAADLRELGRLKSIVESCSSLRIESDVVLSALTTQAVEEFTGLLQYVDNLVQAINQLEHDTNLEYLPYDANVVYPSGLGSPKMHAMRLIPWAEKIAADERKDIMDQIRRLTNYRKECRVMAENRQSMERYLIAQLMEKVQL